MPEALTEDQLSAIVQQEITSSLAYDKTELSEKRRKTLEYIRGEMTDWPAEKGRSSVVSRDTSDVISWIMPSIIRVFTASDRMAVCEPVEPSDEQFADEATDGINYAFWKDNPGYQNFYNATYNALAHGNGPVKHWWDETPKVKVSFHSGLTDEQLTALLTPEYEVTEADGEPEEKIELLGQTSRTATVPGEPDPQTGQPVMQQIKLHDVKIKRTTKCGKVALVAVAPEDFLINSEATCIADARMKGNKERKTRSELIEMGFDAGKVAALARDPNDLTDTTRREFQPSDSAATEATELITLYELYLNIDVDGDGVTEEVQVFYAGLGGDGTVLEWQIWEDEPVFSDIPCDPVPHRYEGRSIFDKTSDIQEIKTVLERQALDNLYASNNPQRFATGRILNPDELSNPSFGGTVFGDKDATLTPMAIPFFANHAFEAIGYFDGVIEKRTGVSKTTMALDPEALQDQTATAAQIAHDASYSQIEIIARNQAELGWSSVFRNVLKLMVRHQDKARTIRLRDQWVQIDPRHWNADMDVTINTGIGTGSRERDQVQLAAVKNDQVMLAGAFKEAGMLPQAVGMIPKMIETMKKSAEAAGIRNPEAFYPAVSDQDVQAAIQQIQQMQGQPDPKTQAEIAKGQAQLQMDQQKTQAQLQSDQARAAADIQLQRERMAMESQLKREQLAAEMQLKREQLIAELNLKRELSMYEIQNRSRTEAYKADVSASVSQVHPGGEPG